MKNKVNVLLLGSGGRESAFAFKLSQSKLLNKLYIAPGNGGTANYGTNLPISETDFDGIKKAVLDYNIELVLVGPEAPLVKGVYDYFKNDLQLSKIPVIGPSKNGAILEGSKDFSKQFMFKHQIPTANYKTFTRATLHEGIAFLETLNPPYVLKADGLAAGKGVIISNNLNDAKKELTEMLIEAKFGDAGTKVIIEEYLKGIELSVFVLTDGKSYKILPEAKDYKRVGEGDTGPNTGGMGAVSPVPFADKLFMQKVEERIVKPTIYGLMQDGIDYKGFIFIGLMKVGNNPYVIEYNCRMGDPETEVIIPRIKNDLIEILLAVSYQQLQNINLEVSPETATTIMLVSGGYPGNFEKGKEITGLEQVNDSLIFHAGTKFSNGLILTNGGRVMAITSFGNSIDEAVQKSLKNARLINFDGKYFRTDIGKDLM
jgi:phosphoribosylamine--glycine ligase